MGLKGDDKILVKEIKPYITTLTAQLNLTFFDNREPYVARFGPVMKTENYLVGNIKDGISKCLKNCDNLIFTTNALLNNSINNESGLNHCFVIYSFAVEEFGKAILLDRILQISRGAFNDPSKVDLQKNKIRFRSNSILAETPEWSRGSVIFDKTKDTVTDGVTFSEHRTKIQTVLNEFGPNYLKLVPFDYYPNYDALSQKVFGEGLLNFDTLVNALSVNVEGLSFRIGIEERIRAIMISNALASLNIKLNEWRNQLGE